MKTREEKQQKYKQIVADILEGDNNPQSKWYKFKGGDLRLSKRIWVGYGNYYSPDSFKGFIINVMLLPFVFIDYDHKGVDCDAGGAYVGLHFGWLIFDFWINIDCTKHYD